MVEGSERSRWLARQPPPVALSARPKRQQRPSRKLPLGPDTTPSPLDSTGWQVIVRPSLASTGDVASCLYLAYYGQ
jgi:hypothetical protein